MRLFFLARLARLAPVASICLAAVALGQNLPNDGRSASTAGPNLFPSYYADVDGPHPLGTLTRTPPVESATRQEQPADKWLTSSAPSPGYSLGEWGAVCDDCPKRGLVAFVSYDTFRGVADAGWQNNGIASGVNFGTRLGRFSDVTGIGFQIGGSAAAYNWVGNDFHTAHQEGAQPQGFLTYGLFRKATDDSPWSAAVVQDWMFNDNYGVFAENPTLSQWRGQLGYAFDAWNEIGLWGTWRARGDERNVANFGPTSWRTVNQLSVFLHHKWGLGGADTSLWVGIPEHHRLGGSGSLGDLLIGLSGSVPISDRLALFSLVTYMHPSADAGAIAFDEEAWNFTIGLSFYPGRNARSNTVAGQCWMPLLPVANNGYFLTDTNRTF